MSVGWDSRFFASLDQAGQSSYMDRYEARHAAEQEARFEHASALGEAVMSSDFGQELGNLNGLIGRISTLTENVGTSGVAIIPNTHRLVRKRVVDGEGRYPGGFSTVSLRTFHPLIPGRPKVTLGARVQAMDGDHLLSARAIFDISFTAEEVVIDGFTHSGLLLPRGENEEALGAMNLISWLETAATAE